MEERVRKCGCENLKVLIQGVRIQLFVLTHEIYLPLDRNLHRQTLADEKAVLQHQIGVEGVFGFCPVGSTCKEDLTCLALIEFV